MAAISVLFGPGDIAVLGGSVKIGLLIWRGDGKM